MRPQSGMDRAECARAGACLRGHIPGGAPVRRCGTRPESPGPSKESKYYRVVPECGACGVTLLAGASAAPAERPPSSHPHLAQRASWDLCRASLSIPEDRFALFDEGSHALLLV